MTSWSENLNFHFWKSSICSLEKFPCPEKWVFRIESQILGNPFNIFDVHCFPGYLVPWRTSNQIFFGTQPVFFGFFHDFFSSISKIRDRNYRMFWKIFVSHPQSAIPNHFCWLLTCRESWSPDDTRKSHFLWNNHRNPLRSQRKRGMWRITWKSLLWCFSKNYVAISKLRK